MDGLVYLLEQALLRLPDRRDLADELLAFVERPSGRVEGSGAHDDLVCALALAAAALPGPGGFVSRGCGIDRLSRRHGTDARRFALPRAIACRKMSASPAQKRRRRNLYGRDVSLAGAAQRIEEQAPKDNQRLQNSLAALRDTLQGDAEKQEEDDEAPRRVRRGLRQAHRARATGWACSCTGSTASRVRREARADRPGRPGVRRAGRSQGRDRGSSTGARVKVNEAYAVVGVLPASGQGSVQKVADALSGWAAAAWATTRRAAMAASSFARRGAEGRPIKTGDEVRVDPTGRIALEHYEKQESRDYFLEEVPEIPWEKVGGQKEAIALIRDTIEHAPAPPGDLRAVRQEADQGHPALRPSRLRQDPHRQGDRVQPDEGVQQAASGTR